MIYKATIHLAYICRGLSLRIESRSTSGLFTLVLFCILGTSFPLTGNVCFRFCHVQSDLGLRVHNAQLLDTSQRWDSVRFERSRNPMRRELLRWIGRLFNNDEDSPKRLILYFIVTHPALASAERGRWCQLTSMSEVRYLV